MRISDVTTCLENWAPAALQESYDNSGLLIGNRSGKVSKALISLDLTEEVLEEAVAQSCDIIISHHPLIFSGLKRLTGKNATERIAMEAIRKDIAIYAIHTNLDNTFTGVNKRISDILGLKDVKILDPKKGQLRKLSVFVPDTILDYGRPAPEVVRQALWQAGAGHIGKYDQCSFNTEGEGSFRAGAGTDPFIGSEGELSFTSEIRIEVIYPEWIEGRMIAALKQVHPYEEVAYDLVKLENVNQETGAGMVGVLENEMYEHDFLKMLKSKMDTDCVRYSPLTGRKVKKVAVCGGAGSFLLNAAIRQGADAFVTADYKYHQFFEAEGRILITDIGHYESERFTIDLLFEYLQEKFPTFALLKTSVVTNPVNYL